MFSVRFFFFSLYLNIHCWSKDVEHFFFQFLLKCTQFNVSMYSKLKALNKKKNHHHASYIFISSNEPFFADITSEHIFSTTEIKYCSRSSSRHCCRRSRKCVAFASCFAFTLLSSSSQTSSVTVLAMI